MRQPSTATVWRCLSLGTAICIGIGRYSKVSESNQHWKKVEQCVPSNSSNSSVSNSRLYFDKTSQLTGPYLLVAVWGRCVPILAAFAHFGPKPKSTHGKPEPDMHKQQSDLIQKGLDKRHKAHSNTTEPYPGKSEFNTAQDTWKWGNILYCSVFGWGIHWLFPHCQISQLTTTFQQ